MNGRATVLLVIPHLGGGGAERVFTLLAGGLNPARFDIHLALVTQWNAAEFELPTWVTVHGIGARRVRAGWWGLLRLIWRLRPRVILSGMAHLNMLLLILRPLFPRNTRILVRQNGCIRAAGSISAYRKLYPKADAVVCQTAAMAGDLAKVAGVKRNLRVLPNPVDLEKTRAAALSGPNLWSGPGPHLLAVGRLAPEKGFDLLLQAFAKVRERFPSADLTIVGEGRERRALEMLAWLLGVRQAARLLGHVEQPAIWFKGATAFVLSSRHEALPNAVLEAASAGLPIVATAVSEGLLDLMRGDPGVWIAKEASAEAIAEALGEALERVTPDTRFAHSWVEAFSKDRAIAAYEACIDESLAEPVR
ncbi:glycosyltransferase [Occallatibacter riparius]|uniref:Glycosyltransferase n=1 Tax=Occallatibacter riparius TaxID=1002689 RepID=A0A9J7BPP1_9BACT|nr:glycosyltransferase [Occallatibacter riparius]UWZ82894.1 glycosyltransferase [Occallatibacter riparius]